MLPLLKLPMLYISGATASSGPGPPNSRNFQITHNEAPQSIGLLWTSDQLVAETSTCTTHNIHNEQTSIHTGWIRTHNLSRRAAADPRLRPHDHWGRLTMFFTLAQQPPVGQGLLIHEISRSHTTTPHHSRQDSSGRIISSSQRPLPAQHTTFITNRHPFTPVGFEPTISAGERPQTYALDRATTGTGFPCFSFTKNFFSMYIPPRQNTILGAFEKLREATFSFVVSLRLFVRMEQLGFHWRVFHQI